MATVHDGRLPPVVGSPPYEMRTLLESCLNFYGQKSARMGTHCQ
jgi:hypothetical protein